MEIDLEHLEDDHELPEDAEIIQKKVEDSIREDYEDAFEENYEDAFEDLIREDYEDDHELPEDAEIILEEVEDPIGEDYEDDDAMMILFKAIKASLRSSLGTKAKAQKIANDVRLIVFKGLPGYHWSGLLFNFWSLVLDLVYVSPLNHPWLDIMAQCFRILHDRGGEVSSDSEASHANKTRWEEFSGFNTFMTDMLNALPFWEGDEVEPSTIWYPETLAEDLARCKKLHSFLARLGGAGLTDLIEQHCLCAPWVALEPQGLAYNAVIARLANADLTDLTKPYLCGAPALALKEYPGLELEYMPRKGVRTDCGVWLVTEWILRCGGMLLDRLYEEEPTAPGSVGLWYLWKRRLIEISANSDIMEISDTTCARIQDAVQRMTVIAEQRRETHGSR
ncbi:hypothetical protein QBC46DRAFT_434755 [Diplogelasinospora grovesii]|uniref:Uncharacterized protein n=1 Tax=Diplogelasinospora grovesii TaxID=303347 RepID=A0AAN6N9Y4_9PEZI|nr:hypothetical protein QBC46DRAFT_434755 [Diplogelasinospora grovesii]